MTEGRHGPGAGRVTIENVNHPGRTSSADAEIYGVMRRALLTVLPTRAPGLSQAEMQIAVLPELPDDLFPGGAKAGWWTKTVQLDLEAKGLVVREMSKPLRWHKDLK